ncbi:MAG: ferrous iron transporter B, partial [Clostridia bacterium]|nr:ferrous iron transporter B [Clostridia bacterium]
TVSGANYLSAGLSWLFSWGQWGIWYLGQGLHCPQWLTGFLADGVYLCVSSVVAVMLPPMAIFFPCFALLEDSGYLPRAAFNLDRIFKKVGTNGQQALTMSVGFGCNAAGVLACRIIENPRERLIAMLTNCFVPCNGRFPLLIALAGVGVLMGGSSSSWLVALIVLGVVLLGMGISLLVSRLLSLTILKGEASAFVLELPSYRKPQWGKVIVRALKDRLYFVLRRAVLVSIPAGAVIWLLANIQWQGLSYLTHLANFLDPAARLLGLDGYILTAFLLALPANEIVLPILLMGYLASSSLGEIANWQSLYQLLAVEQHWSITTIICTILFSLLHFPCSTTLLTIRKESGSAWWMLAGFLIPTAVAALTCFLVCQTAHYLGLN